MDFSILQHAGNCHGEWNALFAIIAAFPFGPVILGWYLRRRKHDHR
jgi:hypothetical protein